MLPFRILCRSGPPSPDQRHLSETRDRLGIEPFFRAPPHGTGRRRCDGASPAMDTPSLTIPPSAPYSIHGTGQRTPPGTARQTPRRASCQGAGRRILANGPVPWDRAAICGSTRNSAANWRKPTSPPSASVSSFPWARHSRGHRATGVSDSAPSARASPPGNRAPRNSSDPG